MEMELEEKPKTVQELLGEADERGYLTVEEILETLPQAEDKLNRLNREVPPLRRQRGMSD
jgi:hypothetical protein